LKPPLGKPNELIEIEGDLEEESNANKGRKEERYVVNYEKGIVLRKR